MKLIVTGIIFVALYGMGMWMILTNKIGEVKSLKKENDEQPIQNDKNILIQEKFNEKEKIILDKIKE